MQHAGAHMRHAGEHMRHAATHTWSGSSEAESEADSPSESTSPSRPGPEASEAVARGGESLALLRRQQVVGNLFPAAPSVMEAEAAVAFEKVKR